jgi:regulator of protease activity HflC (stomatin/prohibitin superfamily)
MNSLSTKSASQEQPTSALNGWGMLVFNGVWFIGAVAWSFGVAYETSKTHDSAGLWWLIPALLLVIAAAIAMGGFFTLQPNEARVLILFGAYKGTVRASGFWWANPFYACSRNPLATLAPKSAATKISLRARNFNSEKIKVNDKRGNPVEIAAVVVWRVEDTARAAFDVDDFESYVHIQSESAIRHIASLYAYDRSEENEFTLRESADEVAAAMKKELLERLDKAGVIVEEARLTHLAYAPEIAQAMLRRQQAEAVIAARQKIVHGAVSMVDMALRELSEKGVVKLDEERKASMVSNLLVVLCGETEAKPVINTGTLYQ